MCAKIGQTTAEKAAEAGVQGREKASSAWRRRPQSEYFYDKLDALKCLLERMNE